MFENPGFSPTSNEGSRVGATYNSSSYNQAINDSRFVKGFGITALIYALVSILGLTLLGGGIGLAISALIMLLFMIGLIAIFLNLVPSSQR